jgi:peptide/nickel transport system permease protein
MLRLIARRLLLSVALVIIVSGLTFVLETLTPGDAARTILGNQFDPVRYEELRRQLGLDDPVPVQYWHWLQDAVHGSLGASLFTGQAVAAALNERLGVTLSLVFGTVLLAGLAGVVLGVVTALRGGIVGRAVDALSLVGFALPAFWLGLVLIAVFAVAWPVLPATGTGYEPLTAAPGVWLENMVLPVVTLTVGAIAVIAKQTRDGMLDVLDQEFVWALRARGISERSIVFKHALRSAAIPIVTLLGLLFVGLLGGTVLPGLGSLAVQATVQHDIPVVQGVAVYFTLIVVAVNLVLDLVYAWLNPKVRTA